MFNEGTVESVNLELPTIEVLSVMTLNRGQFGVGEIQRKVRLIRIPS